MNLPYKIKIGGFGGQGVLFLGKLIAEIANKKGFNITWLPSYGPEMRGGTANCSVVVSKQNIATPVVEKPNVLIVFNQPSFEKFYPVIEDDALVFADSVLVKTDKENVELIDASQKAEKIGNKKVANMVVAGVVLKRLDLYDEEVIRDVLKDSGMKDDIVKLNIEALNV
jgi:Pyruvate/2-oxoacid:ferredoxin oxidoreductase gamma subunit